MRRRDLFSLMALAPVAAPRQAAAQEKAERGARGGPSPKIKDVSVIATQPGGVRLTVVKIVTDQDGLYGYGCATFTQRAELVGPAVEKYLKPFLIGKPTDRIDDTWQACYNSSYWRNGPVLNNAISGVDEALWDIKGRQAGMPVYQLLGGKMREACATYTSVSGAEIPQVIDNARKAMANGYHHVRLQIGVPGMAAYGAGGGAGERPKALHDRPVFEPGPYMRRAVRMLHEARKALGDDVELLHDMHERVTPREAVQFAKDVEDVKLFYLEDALSPEDIAYFRQIRQQCNTPLAMGELFNSPHEWTPLITERLIDYIRIHVSQAGGVTPCRKIAILGEMFGVKTAWHGPGDVSPVGHTANLHLDLASYNFGVQEGGVIRGVEAEIFKGCATFKDGYLWAGDAPGWGIEIDEKLAAKYPFREGRDGLNGGWSDVRRLDGTVIKQ
ncbi:MAG TPA: enolase C-terminal domain-like protein [Candidatus Sulfopaludibacter sp.]|nr:enolase C-terminal domain-like protein [Candidatus Sulfopaludibacter sp.]